MLNYPVASKNPECAMKLSSQSFIFPMTSSFEEFAGKNMNSVYNSGISCPIGNSFTTACGSYPSLPRRRSTDQYLRRAVSYEPRGQEIKQVIVKSPSQNEIESDYVTLDKRYVPPTYTRMSGVTEGIVTSPRSSFNEHLQRSVNSSPVQICHIHHHASDSDLIHAYPVIASTNHVRLNESMLKTNTLLDSRKQTPRKKISSGTFQSMAEIIGSLFSNRISTDNFKKSDQQLTSVNRSGRVHENARLLTRSKSLSDLQMGSDESNRNYSDDEDGDDFGFLSYPILFMPSCTSAAMNKAKSPSPGNRIFTKRWRKKTNAVPSLSTSVAMWTPGPPGSCSWSSVSGRKVQLRSVSILSLTEAERMTLQKIALSRIQIMDIGCAVSIPKETSDLPRPKKSPLSLKRRSKSVSAPALDTMVKDGTAPGMVFGIPLLKCILNDRELEKRRRRLAAVGPAASPSSTRTDSSDNLLNFRSTRKSSSSSQGSTENSSSVVTQRLESLTVPPNKRTASSDSLSDSSNNTNSSLIDALSLSTSNPASRPSSLAMDSSHLANQGEAQVPYVVKSCFKHIETYGLQTLGIFRVGSSKKRVKQLREEFDCGREVELTDQHNPHDVGALLKEYFRDLPEPLFTRELYLPFLYAERLKDESERHNAISLLICMLPVPNRDTLWALLRFLAVVSQHATDIPDGKGGTIAGNKMDSHNLATLFGPNILHRMKASNDKELMSESVERVEQSKEVIEVVKDMIDNHHELFEISERLRDDVLRLLVHSNQETVDKILKCLANQNQIETDPESMCSVFEDSSNSPVLYHSRNSDIDLVTYAHKHTVASHRPLRVTKSADDSLDSPTSSFLEPQFFSPTSRDSPNSLPSNPTTLVQHRFDSSHGYTSPVSNRILVVKKSCDIVNAEVVFRSRLETSNIERPYSEGFNQSLNIPRPHYLRENSNSSINSGLSSLSNYSGSDNNQFGQWILPNSSTSQTSSPKLLFRSASSSSTLIASPDISQFNYTHLTSDNCENQMPTSSVQWERERWRYWEKIAAQKKAVETEQETLV